MIGCSSRKSTMQTIKKFRTRELLRLANHLKTFGPLPEPPKFATTENTIQLPNPFLPKFNTKSGKWHKPSYSLRRQADLVKKAHATGSMHLLPPGPKKIAFESRMQRVAAATGKLPSSVPAGQAEKWQVPVQWIGKVPEKKVVGAELGIRLYAGKKRMFKGHLWERVRAKRTRRRSILMRDMAARIKNYKTVLVFFCKTHRILISPPFRSITRRENQTHSNRQDIQNHPSCHSNTFIYVTMQRI